MRQLRQALQVPRASRSPPAPRSRRNPRPGRSVRARPGRSPAVHRGRSSGVAGRGARRWRPAPLLPLDGGAVGGEQFAAGGREVVEDLRVALDDRLDGRLRLRDQLLCHALRGGRATVRRRAGPARRPCRRRRRRACAAPRPALPGCGPYCARRRAFSAARSSAQAVAQASASGASGSAASLMAAAPVTDADGGLLFDVTRTGRSVQ